MAAEPIPHELLLRHAGFLRRLARDLVGDPAAADDAVQEVWLRALEKPPRHGSNVRGWLRVVLTNLVRTKARGESRRERRERERALASGSEAFAPNANDEATLRSVTEAVLALDEPLRTTVLQHYFQGLTTTEIATRDHLSVSTVKSRLQRALEVLRVRIKDASGDSWRSTLLALAFPPNIGKGVILMSLKAKLAIACVALIGSIVVYERVTSRPEIPLESADTPALATPAPKPPPESKPLAAAPDAAEPRAAVPASIPAAGARQDTLLYGSLLDREGKPIQGRQWESVGITDVNGKLHVADAKTEGAYAFHAIPYGKYWLRATVEGFLANEQVLELQPAQPHVLLDLTLQRATRLRILATTPDGEDLSEALQKAGDKHNYLNRAVCPVATGERPGTWWTENDGNCSNPHGLSRFDDDAPWRRTNPAPAEKGYMGILTLTREPPVFVSLLDYHRVLQTIEVKLGDEEVHFVSSADAIVALSATVRMQVVDADTLKPIKGAVVLIESGNGGGGGGAPPSNEDGVVVVKWLDPGQYELRVHSKGYAICSRQFLAEGGPNSDLGQIALEPEVPFEARIVDASGAPFNASFHLGVLDAGTRAVTLDSNMSYGSRGGLLQIVGLGRQIYVLRTDNLDHASEQGDPQTKWVSGNLLLDLRSGTAPANYEIRLAPARRLLILKSGNLVGLKFRILDEAGLPLAGYRLYESAPSAISLPDGNYRVQLLEPGGKLLSERPVALGPDGATVELSR
jgi:RNA polymerase sigma-70 factor (ECF subfamily)